MLLKYLAPNQAWAFIYGDSIVQLEGEPSLFPQLSTAIKAADRKGLTVKHGKVVAKAN